MSWLDEKLQKFGANEGRERDIRGNAHVLLNAVWEEIINISDEAKAKGFQMVATGSSELRRMNYVSGPTRKENVQTTKNLSEYCEVSLSADRHELKVSGLRGERIMFEIRPCPQGIVCLYSGDKLVGPEEVARVIMGRLLFGD